MRVRGVSADGRPTASASYAGYLQLDRLLGAQRPLSDPPHHDELLFIIQHQTTELWLKLILHELSGALEHLRADRPDPCLKVLGRVRVVQRLLFEQWGVLETLTPSEYARFRHVLGGASGLQSVQYRAIELLLGERRRGALDAAGDDAEGHRLLAGILARPGLYDELLRHLARQGHGVPAVCLERDWSLPRRSVPELVPVFLRIYDEPERYWRAYALCERLVDLDEQFQLWRFRHLKTVERIIGMKPGTGGTAGVPYLRAAVERRFFPELIDVRTRIGV